jgi:hypothetical protein
VSILHTSFELTTTLTPHEAMDRIARRLALSGAHFQMLGETIADAHAPAPDLSYRFDWRRPRNFFRLSAFAYVTGIDVHTESIGRDTSKVIVRVNRSRAVGWFAYYFAIIAIISFAMPWPGGPIAVAGIGVGGWLLFVELLGGYGVRKELRDTLATADPILLDR